MYLSHGVHHNFTDDYVGHAETIPLKLKFEYNFSKNKIS